MLFIVCYGCEPFIIPSHGSRKFFNLARQLDGFLSFHFESIRIYENNTFSFDLTAGSNEQILPGIVCEIVGMVNTERTRHFDDAESIQPDFDDFALINVSVKKREICIALMCTCPLQRIVFIQFFFLFLSEVKKRTVLRQQSHRCFPGKRF